MKTDSQLQQDVICELEWDPAINAAGIGVEVKSGIVTLAGEVASYDEKLCAESAAQRVGGVNALTIDMKVKIPGIGIRTDSDIAQAADKNLAWISSVSKKPLKVMVEKGWVTLSGAVEWQYQRQDAAACVRYLAGVTGVSNDIAIEPSLLAAVVKGDIEAALRRIAAADAKAISVKVDGAQVTLSGTVHSWAERDVATRSAWGSAGVRKVVDELNFIY